MLMALLRGNPTARLLHHGLRAAPHRPIIIGPVLAQAWRPDPKTVHAATLDHADIVIEQV
jgi:hypothetical protein